MTERTLILIKPDGVQRGLVGEIVSRIERKGLPLAALALRLADRATAEKHYAEHVGKPFYEGLVEFVTASPLIAGVVEGERAIEAWRQIAGATDPVSAATPGTIRGDFALSVGENVVHGSDSVESAEREIAIWFPELAK
ncbi:nucleoside-diphosphate kinase [Corynebacterium neomassiliense]|uniref:nucleoside-diphosphate kinase n=1 Tax=Corynebacterium neomassiliense TaxID=2079482 RepID=UPI00103138AE|nr:nucleoside-diphosphate kinase [Corynebacterium neomassiliense]